MQYKNRLTQLLGLITTIISIGMIYLILFKDGRIQSISPSMFIEFVVVVTIGISTKFFWFTSTESTLRSSKDYLDKRAIVTKCIEDHIDDAADFDTFVDLENIGNYNRYVSNRCQYMTEENYKLSIFDRLHRIFTKESKKFYMVKYMRKIERKAGKLHKLSGSNIRSLAQTKDGLVDDRNHVQHKKLAGLLTGGALSFIWMFLVATVVFDDKQNIDVARAVLKMIMYSSQILFSILQSVLKAKSVVVKEDFDYFNRILSIIEKYQAYKANAYTVEKVSYIPMEVDNEAEINVATSV